ncbi:MULTISPECIES: HlyD family secretion protein [Sphingobacterium]|uniref:HlyD family secretion protein n=1 Tax=Sphingobacterium TaxID=28453 RepID=UPI0013DC972D|nr:MULTISPECIES: HlyD family efflux transporter periplasmic adaptor subunit [unclassified Sphingobacterium]
MRKTIIIYQILLLGIALAVVALPLIKVPISVSARGTVRPNQENTKIISLVSGRIIKSALYTNNQLVHQGDTLLIITSETLHSKKDYQQQMRQDYESQLRDLKSLVNHTPQAVQTGLYQLEWSALQQRLSEIQTQITLAKKELDRNSTLYQDGVISLAEYEKTLYQHEQLQGQRNALREQQFATWQSKKRELEQQLISLSSDVATLDIEADNYIVKAPVTGRITNLQGFQSGNHLMQGQHLADISVEDALVAECLVPTSAIGYIQTGQAVKFQIDTYHYNQWGMLDGEVLDINNNLMTNEQTGESYFVVRCKLAQHHLSLKNGYRGQVGKGNTYTARFYLTDRTLWQLLFDKVDDWFNPNLKNQYS